MTESLAALAGMRWRPVRDLLGVGAAPEQVAVRLGTLDGERGVVYLRGRWAGGGAIVTSQPRVMLPADADPYAALAVPLARDAPADAGEDFVGGGWFGWLGYDGTHHWAFHDHLLRWQDGAWWFEALHTAERDAVLTARRDVLAAVVSGADQAPLPWRAGPAVGAQQAVHLDAVERAIADIRAGEIYQVNICTRLGGAFDGSALAMFAEASARLDPAYGAYLTDGLHSVLSLSPELFLHRQGREVVTSPIKGTAPREPGAAGNRGAQRLRGSAKDAAENVMIVDLMRNDLGRVSATGSVQVDTLLDIQSHPGVWHLVSTVHGVLREDVDDADLLRATFPPGSVTGAPKQRATELIGQYEAVSRGVYTGAVGYLSPAAGLELSVAIRTFELHGSGYELGVGGGVTADSVPMLEWRECLDKAAPLLAAVGVTAPEESPDAAPTAAQLAGGLLETILVRGGTALRLADHIARLDRSCRELYGAGVPADLVVRARALAADAQAERSVLRVVISPALDVSLRCSPARPAPHASHARAVQGRSGLWRHKWADRTELAAAETFADAAEIVSSFEAGSPARAQWGGAAVPLFAAPDGSLLETSRGNVMVLMPDGALWTPALTDAVLPGVTRRAVLDLARDAGWAVRLGPIRSEDLHAGVAFWTSSLSGAVPIHRLDGESLPRDDAAVGRIAALLAGPQQSGGGQTLR